MVLAGRAECRGAPPGLEDAFPGRWDPRRSIPEEARALVHAVARAAELAGWGRPLEGGLVVGVDGLPEAARRFALAIGDPAPRALSPADFLFSLPSSPAALVGISLGLLEYQAVVTRDGRSGLAALLHAADLLRSGRLERTVAALQVQRAGEELAVAWCLEARTGPAAGNEIVLGTGLESPLGFERPSLP